MTFEWDEAKRRSNLIKHGLDFADVESFWEAFRHTEYDGRDGYGEDRWLTIALLQGRLFVVVAYTERGADVIRVISFRRASTYERRIYEEAFRNRLGEVGGDEG